MTPQSLPRLSSALCLALCFSCGSRATDKLGSATSFLTSYSDESNTCDSIPELFASQNMWLTFTITENAGAISTLVAKRWLTSTDLKGVVTLEETEETSLEIIEEKNVLKPHKTSLLVAADLDIKGFTVIPAAAETARTCTSVDFLTNGRFTVHFSGTSEYVVAIPAPITAATQSLANVETGVGLWTAPLGTVAESFIPSAQMFGIDVIAPLPTHYLHVAKDEGLVVVTDPNFPQKYIPQLISAIQQWNAALGWPALSLNKSGEQSPTTDCISKRTICIRWTGSEDFAWTGYSGVGVPSFDPSSGIIQGGVIQIFNQATPDAFTEGDATVMSQLTSAGSPDLEVVANVFMQRDTYKTIKRKDSRGLVQWLLLHELGHTLGLGHDFLGSLVGTTSMPSETIMDYPPFPVAHRLSQLGKRDLERMALVYGGQRNTLNPPPAACADFDTSPLMRNGFLEKKNSLCNAYDVGDSTLWLSTLAASHGVMAEIPFPFQIPLPSHVDSDRSIVVSLGFLLLDPATPPHQKLTITNLICNDSNQAKASHLLQSRLNLILDCNIKP